MADTKQQRPPFPLRALAAFAVTLAALFVLLLAAYALPGDRVRDHVYESAQTIAGEGLYPEYFGFKLFQMDNYTDTIMLTEAAAADEAFKKGVEMTMNQLKEVLTKLGITEIPAQGQPFDPKYHNAVMHVEDESAGENTVVEVFQQGYALGDKVLRFAMVKVAN